MPQRSVFSRSSSDISVISSSGRTSLSSRDMSFLTGTCPRRTHASSQGASHAVQGKDSEKEAAAPFSLLNQILRSLFAGSKAYGHAAEQGASWHNTQLIMSDRRITLSNSALIFPPFRNNNSCLHTSSGRHFSGDRSFQQLRRLQKFELPAEAASGSPDAGDKPFHICRT